ncbi:MAG TPA: hypothetical protein VN829_06845 [Dongiaceae bacterium]|nr:hypothetical protein [Dongiaceae bacterium]
MKPIEKEELYAHLSDFLKNKGIELKEGSYSNLIHNGCKVLAEAINLSQKGVRRAKSGLDGKLDEMREFIHQKTAPKRPAKPPAAPAAASATGPGVETHPADAPPAQSPPPEAPKAGKARRAKASKKAAPVRGRKARP